MRRRLLHDGRLYVMSNSGILHCFDAVSGKKYWQFVAGRIGKGSPVWADGKIYLTTANGTFVILEDQGDFCRKIDSIDFNTGGEEGIEIFALAGSLRRPHRLLHHDRNGLLWQEGREAASRLPLRNCPRGGPGEGTRRTGDPAGRGVAQAGRDRQFHVLAYDRHGRRIGPIDSKCSFPLKLGALMRRAGSRPASAAASARCGPSVGS